MRNSKLGLVILMSASVVPFISAQTNVFPTSGSVGIGTLSPSSALHVEGTLTIQGQRVASADANYIYYGDILGGDGLRNLALRAGDQNQLFVTTGGNVGIGTGAPGSKLEIRGEHGDTAVRLFSDSYGQGVNGANTAMLYLWASEPGITWTGTGIGNNIKNGNGINRVTTTRGGSYMRLLDNAVSISAVDSNGVDRTALYASGGNVGIGTTSPPYLLTVRGDGSSGLATIAIQDSSNSDKEWRIDQNVGAFRIIESGVVEALRVAPGGNVGIGTASPTHKLAVNGTIRAKEVIVDTGWADYVFADDYDLASLSEVEAHIEEKGHLPDIPSATDVAANGVSVGEMQSLLLAKIEELTLHQIAQEKRIQLLESKNRELPSRRELK